MMVGLRIGQMGTNDPFNLRNESRNRGSYQLREAVAVAEVLSSDGDDRGWGRCSVEFLGQFEDFGRRVHVRKLPAWGLLHFGRGDLPDADFAGSGVVRIVHAGGIKKQHEFTVPQCVCDFGCELMQAPNFHLGDGKFTFERFRSTPGNAVITAQRIAVGDDENGRRHAGTVIPTQTKTAEDAEDADELFETLCVLRVLCGFHC